MIWSIVLLGVGLRFINLNQSLWLDEAINVLAVQHFSLWGLITEYAKSDFHPPLFFVILWGWTKLFGVGEIISRLPSVLFGTLTIYIVYLLGKKLHSVKLGLISALLVATNPLHIYYSQEARMYSLAAMVVTLNILLLCKIIKHEKVNIFFLVVSNLLVFASDYVAYLIFPAQLLFLILSGQKQVIKKWFIGFLTAILLWSIWTPVFLNQLMVGSQTSQNLPVWKMVVGGFDIKAAPLTLVKFIIGRISLTNKLIYFSLLIPICSLFIFLVIKGLRVIHANYRNLLISWLIMPIILGLIISLFIPIYSYFRLLFVLPVFLILVSLGIMSFSGRLKYLLLVIILLIQVSSSAIYLFNSKYQREDWRGLVGYLKNKEKGYTLFESSGSFSPFDYYSQNRVSAFGALKKIPANDDNDLIELEISNNKDIFLVDYLVDITDPKRLVREKLIGLGYTLTETKDFAGVGFVYHYVK